uniref:Uncharacterized protein n=1 Tax=viral metagenome TaxID=1070528 RepID=A0A6M3LMB1_9ZZZZ
MNTIQDFAKLVEKEHNDRREKEYPNLQHYELVKIKPGKKYTKVDVGSSGKFMVDADGNIFGIKGYGVIHRGKRYGTLDTINEYYWGNYSPIKRTDT